MMNRKNLIVIIAISAIIGLLLTACDNGTGGSNGGGNNNGSIYAMGDTGPGGGKVFYDKGSVSNGWRYLEASLVNQGTSLAWASFGYDRTDIIGTGTTVGTGKANTAVILAVDINAPAAKACKDYNGGGKNDWFLPSKDELIELFKQKSHFGITTGNFWSSSQYNARNAWNQYFDDGYQNYDFKNYTIDVRAIRAF